MKSNLKINVTLRNHKGEKKTASITGFGHIETGILVGRISTTKGKWSKGEKIFPTVCMFTGCPLVAFLDKGVKNPWTSMHGSYEGRSIISSHQFSANTHITTNGLKNGKIIMELEIKLEGKLPELQDIEKPFIEIIEKKKNAFLRGKFNINFSSRQGSIPCKVETEYQLATKNVVPKIYRAVSIVISDQLDGTIMEYEQIDMYTNRKRANDNLHERLKVSRI